MAETDAVEGLTLSPDAQIAGSKTASATADRISKRILACVLCQQRKVKCDRKFPCSNCLKARVQCVSAAPAPPRRRRKLPEIDLNARLKQYKTLLRAFGVKFNESGEVVGGFPTGDQTNFTAEQDPFHLPPHDNGNLGRPITFPNDPSEFGDAGNETGRLVLMEGKSRYVDNSLWNSLNDEFLSPREMIEDVSSEEDDAETPESNSTPGRFFVPDLSTLILEAGAPVMSLLALHPQPVHIFMLWQAFRDNVDPLTKLFHAPTVQQSILEASADLENISKATEALMFSIYCIATVSLTESECQTKFGEARETLLARCQTGAVQALRRADLLKTSDIVILQAFILFLLSVREKYDPRTQWVLSGCALRIAQRIGLHRDNTSLGIPVFEMEMRRRTMWQLVILDSRAGQLAGIGHSAVGATFDTKVPANLNDSDLNIGMKELPVEHGGTTEMTFCLLRYEVGSFLKRISSNPSYDASWSRLSSPAMATNSKEVAIDELERIFQEKYLKYCDPVVPMHYLCFGMARTVIAKMRLMMHAYSGDPSTMSDADRDSLFSNSILVMEYDNLGVKSDTLLRFRWHMNSFFQLDAFIYMVSELRRRTTGDMAERAWSLVEDAYIYHPEFFRQLKNPLTLAAGNLTLKAWEERQKALAKLQETDPIQVPPFIAQLAAHRLRKQAKSNSAFNLSGNTPVSLLETPDPMAGIEVPDFSMSASEAYFANVDFDAMKLFESLPADQGPIDWTYWAEVSQGVDYDFGNVGSANLDMTSEYYACQGNDENI